MTSTRTNNCSHEIITLQSINTNEDENHENITLIWYDAKCIDDENPDVLLTKQSLRRINNFVQFFDEETACLNYIKGISMEKVFLIISGRLCSSSLDLFHSLVQIESIFIFCIHRERYLSFLDQFEKIIGIYTDQNQLTISIKQTIEQCELNSAKFNFSKSPQKNMRCLDSECGSFVFFQLFKEVIHHMPSTPEAKSDMINHCQKDYLGNEEELENIETFKQTYTANKSIQWYSKDCFVYRIINKILRTENIDAFFAYRFFINDLCQELLEKHKKFKKNLQSKQLTVYRGMKLSSEEYKMMRDNIRNLFSMNGFMSCSRNKEVALGFSMKETRRDGCYRILLEISIDIDQADKIIFADITEESEHIEYEILFDIGSAFTLTSCNYDSLQNVYIIQASATNQGAEVAADYIEFQKKKVVHSDIDLMIGHLFADMGQMDKSRQYFESLLKKSPNDEEIACVYYYFAQNHRLKNEYDQALDYYKLSYKMHYEAKPPRESSAAKSLNGIGIVYKKMKEYQKAEDYFQRALKMYKDHLPSDHADIAAVLNNLGNVYYEMEKFDQAMKYFHKAQSMNKKVLPPNHPSNASVLNNIGNVYYKQRNFDRACEIYERALKIREKALVYDHDDIISSLDNLRVTNNELGRLDKAQEYFQRAQTIRQTRSTVN